MEPEPSHPKHLLGGPRSNIFPNQVSDPLNSNLSRIQPFWFPWNGSRRMKKPFLGKIRVKRYNQKARASNPQTHHQVVSEMSAKGLDSKQSTGMGSIDTARALDPKGRPSKTSPAEKYPDVKTNTLWLMNCKLPQPHKAWQRKGGKPIWGEESFKLRVMSRDAFSFTTNMAFPT